jgi:tRNA(fMet)-specific endonuclease VapC
MRFLVDTNVWIVYLKNPDTTVRDRLQSTDPSEVAVCSIVRAELLHGACKYGDPDARREKIERTIGIYRSFPFDDAASAAYANIRHHLELRGELIGGNDLMIASIAIANELAVVTNNTGEFSRVPRLRVEDWSF